MFIFDGGVLSDEQQARITLRDGELSEYRFCAPDETRQLLRSYVWQRVEAAIRAVAAAGTEYLHDGQSARVQPS
jgi:hypothetical protein